MTPSARYSAAIIILDRIMVGAPAERELTSWARSNRFAGSKDRAAIRDIVYDCIRNLRSYGYISGLEGARGVLIGRLLSRKEEISLIFNSQGYAPTSLSDDEKKIVYAQKACMPNAVQMDIPDWIDKKFGSIYDYDLLKSRAPIDIRVNLKKISIEAVISELQKDGIEAYRLDFVKSAIRVDGETRKIPQTKLYLDGFIELQDAGSQALVSELNCPERGTVLDSAYDKSEIRLKELKLRASRAGINVKLLDNDPVKKNQKYDLVIIDVPCTGSGSWRRSPDAKWKLTEDRLEDLIKIQSEILQNTSKLVATGGTLAYMTCSLFDCENQVQIKNFINKNHGWKIILSKKFPLSIRSDGFYLAILSK
ncbi:MAG: RsmB/NOP family class I SAM-dependent RNA methyltransferase [Amylibacter sp.]